MNPIVLFRKGTVETEEEVEEIAASQTYFCTTFSRALIHPGELVIPRYSALPFYKELETDVDIMGGKLLNSHAQHCYVANLDNWYADLKDYTPKTWFRLDDVDTNGPFVLKGLTNSRKNLWNTHMFAEDKKAMTEVYCRLMDDTMISDQNICVREYVPLVKLLDGLNGLPVSNEFRCFFYKDQLLDCGFYWANYVDDITAQLEQPPAEFLYTIASIVSQHINFYVVDVAKTADGRWVVVELNDGQMSGLSMCKPHNVYRELQNCLLGE